MGEEPHDVLDVKNLLILFHELLFRAVSFRLLWSAKAKGTCHWQAPCSLSTETESKTRPAHSGDFRPSKGRDSTAESLFASKRAGYGPAGAAGAATGFF